jgi:hypothetical protein
VIVVLRHFEYILTNGVVLLHLAAIELVEGVIPLDLGVSLKNKLLALGTSHMLHGAQNIFGAPVLSRKAWRTELSSSHIFLSARRS